MIRRQPGICAAWLLAAAVLCLAHAGTVCAQGMRPGGDDVSVTEMTPAKAPPSATPAGDGPLSVSILDIAAKLAALVLLVYAAAWGIKAGRAKGWRLQTVGAAPGDERLAVLSELPLRGGSTLHIVEADGRSVLLATQAAGGVSLLLDLTPPPAPSEPEAERPARGKPFTIIGSVEPTTTSTLQTDASWEERRDALIRALAQRA